MALRAAPAAPMMEELKEMERGMMEEYRIKYKAAQKAREVARKKQIEEEQKKMDKWLSSLTMEEKLEAERSYRLLKETILTPLKGSRNACVYRVKAKCCSSVMDTARCLGLEVSYFELPEAHKDRKGGYHATIVVARRTSIFEINERWRGFLNADERAKRRAAKKEPEQKREMMEYQEESNRDVKGWDVTGRYDVMCHVMEEVTFPVPLMNEFKLEICSQQTGEGAQLVSSLNFGFIEGLMRFKREESFDEESHGTAKTPVIGGKSETAASGSGNPNQGEDED